mmetsp:Transcript_10049/g.28833  ORF Transcript_10049/g.28833 Transcript_10049/m.28833 type:complete len:210 (+) Transcript_10049:2607-3236(+)
MKEAASPHTSCATEPPPSVRVHTATLASSQRIERLASTSTVGAARGSLNSRTSWSFPWYGRDPPARLPSRRTVPARPPRSKKALSSAVWTPAVPSASTSRTVTMAFIGSPDASPCSRPRAAERCSTSGSGPSPRGEVSGKTKMGRAGSSWRSTPPPSDSPSSLRRLPTTAGEGDSSPVSSSSSGRGAQGLTSNCSRRRPPWSRPGRQPG